MYTLKCKALTKIYIINYENFKDLIQLFPNDNEKFSMMQDLVLLNKDFSLIDEKCYSCC